MDKKIDPRALLESLRWDEDTIIMDHVFQRLMWLGPVYNLEGKRIGIGSCCFADEPCDWHEECRKINHVGKKEDV